MKTLISNLKDLATTIGQDLKNLGIGKDNASLLFAVVDEDNNQTWLQVASDGGLTQISEDAIREKLNLFQTEIDDGLFVITDSEGNLTDLWLDNHGKISDTVLHSWNERLKEINAKENIKLQINGHITDLVHKLPVLTTQDLTINKHDTYFQDGELLPVLPDNDKIILLGSSSLENSHDEIFPELQKLNPELTMYKPCFGGSLINQMSAMFGSVPLKLKFDNYQLNANGASNATIINGVNFIKNHMSMTGWVNGIHGTLTANANGFDVIFNRTTSGAVITLSDTVDFIPEKGNEYRNATQVLWIGKNNLTSSNSQLNNVERLMQETDRLLNYNSSFVKRNIIITHFNNQNTPTISEVRNRVNLCNHLYKLRYKSCVFDIEPIILGTKIFTDLKISRTQADIQQQSLGNLPPSLAHDPAHLNKKTNLYIASKIAEFIKSKNWF